jgi:autotransporter family porin
LAWLSACSTDHRIARFGATPGDAGASDLATATRFIKLPAGQPLPTEAACSARVRRSSWEPRPDNQPFNQEVPTAAQLAGLAPWDSQLGIDDRAIPLGLRVTGNFTGTTDEILQWGACKWGLDEDFVRAFAAHTGNWRQDLWSGWTSNTSECPPTPQTRSAFGGVECAQIYGVFQIMFRYHETTWPMSRDSTAFNVDYSLGLQRTCMDGLSSWLADSASAATPYVKDDEWGCAGSWYSGNWYDRDAVPWIESVRQNLETKPWTQADF